MKRIEKVVAVSAGILLFLSAGAWARPVPGAAAHSAKGQKSASAKKKKPEKRKKWQWHGQLVDATCMEKTLHRKLPRRLYAPASNAQRRQYQVANMKGLSTGKAKMYGMQQQGKGVTRQPIQDTAPVGWASGLPTINMRALERASRLEHAAKECTATSATSQFGFLTDIDAIVKFGKIGNSKAIKAIKQVELKPKKPVKATMQGFQPSKGRFMVTSVTVKK